jgi:ABC-type polysaccharide/polyol phosphate transport system ATPase subunit
MRTLNNKLLEVHGVSKKFCRSLKRSFLIGLHDLAHQAVFHRRKLSTELDTHEFWAVKDVSFSVAAGEALGIMGANGEGKTTLLKMIGGIIKPDGGQIHRWGSVAPVFAKGVGFHKLLTCRENIFLNLSLLGRSDSEIRRCFDSIVDFAELTDDLVDAPLKTYSSGLMARLSFACAVEARADLLLVDETLAVGDMRFRAKCYRKMASLREQGTAFILVSHSVGVLNNNTDRALYLRNGRVVADGPTEQVSTRYENDQLFSPYLKNLSVAQDSRAEFLNEQGQVVDTIGCGRMLRIRIASSPEIASAQSIDVSFEELPRGLGLVLRNQWTTSPSAGEDLVLEYPSLGLVAGVYLAHIQLTTREGSTLGITKSLSVKSPAQLSQNICMQPVSWSLHPV